MLDENLVESLLMLVAACGRVRGRTRIQKLAFISQQLAQSGVLQVRFEFQPYFYGPYSSQLNEALATLIDRGLISEESYTANREGQQIEGYVYQLTPTGQLLAERVRDKVPGLSLLYRMVADRFANVPLDKLLGWVYKEYPEMATLALRE